MLAVKTELDKFHVGDKVQFKSWQEMVDEYGLDFDSSGESTNYCATGGDYFTVKMKHLCGSLAIIERITLIGTVYLKILGEYSKDSSTWTYSLDMIKPSHQLLKDTEWI